MNRFPYLVITAFIFAFFSCGRPAENNEEIEVSEKEVPQEQRELKALYDEVLDIHDEVMPKIDDIMQAKGMLQEKLDTLRDMDPENNSIPGLEETIIGLTQADEAMMNWMRNFKPQDDEKDHEIALNYYKDEKVKISEVKDQMLSALEKANQLIKKED
ncbi:MAG: hypothetical protein AAGF85_12140 [Bacteroidota bacterium]